MVYNFPIDQKSLFYNIAPCKKAGYTATVATPIFQNGKVLHGEFLALQKVPTSLSDDESAAIASVILKGKKDFSVNRIWMFKNIQVNGDPIHVDAAYCFYEREQLKSGIHQGRRKLHYGISFRYKSNGLKIDNEAVLKAVAMKMQNEAFIVTDFQYDDGSATLNFITKSVGVKNVAYEDVFESHKGVGNKLTSRAMLYEGEKYKSTSFEEMVGRVYDAAMVAGLAYDKSLVRRFIGASLSKRFVVLSGLSGSGKTKLAQVLASFLREKVYAEFVNRNIFSKGDVIGGAKSLYRIIDADRLGLVVEQGVGTKTFLPYELINKWVEIIEEIGPSKTDAEITKKARSKLKKEYSGNLLSFHAPLCAIARKMISAGAELGVKNVYNSVIVPVGADWTSSEHLLGYPDALRPGKYVMPDTGVLKFLLLAKDNDRLPFFLILDEMNLSHVERYFADFLSAMESGDKIKLYDGAPRSADDGTEVPSALEIPKNLFVIGTMNVDETTYMFSPKVLDRAQVIEFRVSEREMKDFLAKPTTPDLDIIAGKGAKYAEAFLNLKDTPPPLDKGKSTTNKTAITDALGKFFPELAKLGAEFGYRTASEILRFCAYYLATDVPVDDAIDAAIVQKLLPKLHGSQLRLASVLRTLQDLSLREYKVGALDEDKDIPEGTLAYDFANKQRLEKWPEEDKQVWVARYRLTCEKIDRMMKRLKANGFTSFAEA